MNAYFAAQRGILWRRLPGVDGIDNGAILRLIDNAFTQPPRRIFPVRVGQTHEGAIACAPADPADVITPHRRDVIPSRPFGSGAIEADGYRVGRQHGITLVDRQEVRGSRNDDMHRLGDWRSACRRDRGRHRLNNRRGNLCGIIGYRVYWRGGQMCRRATR